MIQSDEDDDFNDTPSPSKDDDFNDTPSPSKHALVPVDSRQSGKALSRVSVSPSPGHWGRLKGLDTIESE